MGDRWAVEGVAAAANVLFRAASTSDGGSCCSCWRCCGGRGVGWAFGGSHPPIPHPILDGAKSQPVPVDTDRWIDEYLD